VALVEMEAAQRQSTMIARAAVTCVGEQDILLLVVADPPSAALGLGKLARLAAQPASRPLLAPDVCGLRRLRATTLFRHVLRSSDEYGKPRAYPMPVASVIALARPTNKTPSLQTRPACGRKSRQRPRVARTDPQRQQAHHRLRSRGEEARRGQLRRAHLSRRIGRRAHRPRPEGAGDNRRNEACLSRSLS